VDELLRDVHRSAVGFPTLFGLRYTPPVTSKKGVIWIGVLIDHCDESRSFCSAEYAASLFVPLFMVARTGERKLRQLTQVVTGTPTRSSYRPQLALGAVVVAKLTTWRAFMAHTASLGAAAPVTSADALTINILPDTGWATYRGSRAQLEAEGVIPSTFLWPDGWCLTHWTAGPNRFRLLRVRPPKAKGSRKELAACDYWQLTIDVVDKPNFADLQIWQQARALKDAIYRTTPAGIASINALVKSCLAAKCDSAFQAAMAQCLPTTRRKPKGAGGNSVCAH
jgi:hypothetical protein